MKFRSVNRGISRWRQCACVHFLAAMTDHKQTEGRGRWVVDLLLSIVSYGKCLFYIDMWPVPFLPTYLMLTLTLIGHGYWIGSKLHVGLRFGLGFYQHPHAYPLYVSQIHSPYFTRGQWVNSVKRTVHTCLSYRKKTLQTVYPMTHKPALKNSKNML